MFRDQVDCQAWKCSEMSTADCAKKCGRDRTAKGGMVVEGKVVLGLVRPENPIGLMGWGGGDGNGPESIVHATACDDDLVVLDERCNHRHKVGQGR